MAPVKVGGGRSLSREDCLCPICLEIFVEPVTLPCSHSFCKVCFLESVDKATLCCPLCRKRVSTWARQHSRNKTLVNEALWKMIQSSFPHSSERGLQGPDADDTEPMSFRRLSEPGAVRQEYEDEVSKLTEEKRALEEQERRASEELIQRLLAEEEEVQKEQRRRQHNDDEKLARILSKELNAAVESQNQVPEKTPVKKKPVGQMDRFLCTLCRSPVHNAQANKENVSVRLSSSADPPQLDVSSPETDQLRPEESQHEAAAIMVVQSERRDMPLEGGAKRTSEARSEEGGSQSSSLVGLATADREVAVQRRRRQEEEDLRVALELQRQLNRQQLQTDRRKGSVDAYLLRAPSIRRPYAPAPASTRKRPRTATISARPAPRRRPPAATATRPTCSARPGPALPKTSHRPPQTAKSNRQTTLTDLFNLHT